MSHHGTVITATPTSVATTASRANWICPSCRLPNRNTAIPAATNTAPAITRHSADQPDSPVRAPSVHRLRWVWSASRQTTAAPIAATPSGPTIHPTNESPAALPAMPTAMPSAASPTACWRSARGTCRTTSAVSCGTKIHSRP